jgi:hypothetical protein
MPPTAADYETAERLDRKRARFLPLFAVLFLAQQASYFSGPNVDAGRPVDYIRTAGWLALSIVLLLVLATGGYWLRSRAVRALMNDEATRVHRTDACRFGFFAAMIACLGLYVLSLFEPLGGREVIHLVLTIGIAAALVRFAMLERRALKDG